MRIAVVGAGLSGLVAARRLASAGHDVLVLDKGRSVGGRLATRRIDGAVLDHGAQFFTVRSEEFAALVHPHLASGLVYEWCRGFGPVADGYPRYAVHGGMNAFAKALADGLDVRSGAMAFAIRPGLGRWRLGLDDGTEIPADALVLTAPVPQSFSLLMTAHVSLPDELRGLEYDRTLGLLAVLDRPSAVPAPGGVQDADETFSFVGDNAAKGISSLPAVTLHVRPTLSEDRWADDRDVVHADLLAAARPWLGAAAVVTSQVKRWRFATPRQPWPERCWMPDAPAPLVLAGDAFGGPKVEGAALSGMAAAELLA
jgi:predicted NAD/FAD-dependent oxidoreductase